MVTTMLPVTEGSKYCAMLVIWRAIFESYNPGRRHNIPMVHEPCFAVFMESDFNHKGCPWIDVMGTHITLSFHNLRISYALLVANDTNCFFF